MFSAPTNENKNARVEGGARAPSERTAALSPHSGTAPSFSGNRYRLNGLGGAVLQRKCDCGGSGGTCDKCKEEKLLQRFPASGVPSAAPGVPPVVHSVLNASGRPLDPGTRAFMEPRFGRDFSGVRIHTDGKAAESAKAVQAQAYTVGGDIVFGGGRYRPESGEGRELLAHELAHVVQQGGGRAEGSIVLGDPFSAAEEQADGAARAALAGGRVNLGPSPCKVQRRLAVNNDPTDAALGSDPAATLPLATRFSMMDSIIQSLCPLFQVDSRTGEVESKNRTSMTSGFVAGGSNPVGCCCLNTLVEASHTWTIHVSRIESSRTQFGPRNVFLPMNDVPYESGARTASGNLAIQGLVPNAGHELCGHAALQELGGHPQSGSRLTTDVHDPTVHIENEISTEQGVPPTELRGLARDGIHRGESVDRITVRQFPFNHFDLPSLPAAEKAKIDFAAAYIKTNNTFADILGHGDIVGPARENQAVSQARANSVKAELRRQGVTDTLTPEDFPSGTITNRFTRVEGLAASQPPAPALQSDRGNWRRVEIQMPVFAAGAERPPSITPTGVTPAPLNPAVPGPTGLKASSDACTNLLVNRAYP
jgi:outer membrane protein OmpA-like peptidoglycan-associated protein